MPTDFSFFITLSSVTGIAGNSSQANYASGNTFEDAVARYRTVKGLPAVSLDLGPVKSISVLTKNNSVADNLAKVGYTSLEEESVLQLIEAGIADPLRTPDTCQVVTGISAGGDGKWETALWKDNLMFAQLKTSRRTSSDANGPKAGGVDLKRSLGVAKMLAEAAHAVCQAISLKLSETFTIPVEDIDRSSKMSKFGVGSLVAVELSNWLGSTSNAEVSILDTMQSPSLLVLSENRRRRANFSERTC